MTKVRTLVGGTAAIALLVGAATSAAAQDSGTAQAPYLRVEWQLDSARGQWRNACGRVFNDRDTPARHVMIMFEGFDSEGHQVSRRFGEVVGDVPGRGYSVFCLMVKAGGATYKVSVPAVEWGPAGQ